MNALRVVAAATAVALLAGASPAPSGRMRTLAAATSPSDDACPPHPPGPTGHQFTGTLTTPNFAGQDLRNADFTQAELVGASFVRADLRGANFSGTTFRAAQAPNARPLPNDFALARLGSACFINAQFLGPINFEHAELSAADFSGTNLTTAQVVFGTRLAYAPAGGADAGGGPAFRGTTMSCDFVAQWPQLDLTGAKGLQACAAQLATLDFSGARLAGADLSNIALPRTRWRGAALRGTNFQGAVLDGAVGLNDPTTDVVRALFNQASVRGVDFSGAKLYGAQFAGAELQGSDFTGAQLIADPSDKLGTAAIFDGAHLLNVSFARATLNSVKFRYASLYGSTLDPTGTCQLAAAGACPAATPRTGATCSCATASGADLTRADFSNAFLFGVDFSTSGTIVNGTVFSDAVLVSANFASASFSVDPSQGGAAPQFDGAWLQGANLQAANLANSTVAGAFVDFGVVTTAGGAKTTVLGNYVAALLSASHVKFRNWHGPNPPCAVLQFDRATQVPTDIGDLTCPVGTSFPGVGCGRALPRDPAAPANPHWKSTGRLAAAPVAGWYQKNSTYEDASSGTCSPFSYDTSWFTPDPPK